MNSSTAFGMSKASRVFPQLISQEQIAAGNSQIFEKTPDRAPIERHLAPAADRNVRTTTLSFANMHEHGELFINYLKMRHEIFILGKGWVLPEADGMEFDQYDTPLARWVVLHEYGEILAGVRIAPTTARCGQHTYMIRDAQIGLLPDLPCNVLFFEAPVSDRIWEATRLFVSPGVPSQRRLRIQHRLLDAMAAAGREVGSTHVIGIVPAVFRRWMNRIGMTATAVGPEMMIAGDRVQAALMDIGEVQSDQRRQSKLSRVA